MATRIRELVYRVKTIEKRLVDPIKVKFKVFDDNGKLLMDLKELLKPTQKPI